ncbi:MAG TPA: ComEC/Rec2 family competence protein [Candidatus Obscuribacterales bacterium]
MLARQGLLLGPRLLVMVALLAGSGATIGAAGLPAGWLALPVLFGLVPAAFARLKHLAVALALVPLAAWSYAGLRTPHPGPGDLSRAIAAGACVFRAEVLRSLPSSASSATVLVAPYEVLFPGRRAASGLALLTVVGAGPPFAGGEHIEVKACLRSPEPRYYPWQFDSKAYLQRRGIFCLARADRSQVKLLSCDPDQARRKSSGSWLVGMIEQARARLISHHRRYAGELEGDLLSAMVLGDRAVELPDTLKQRFRDAGLSHLLAASGFNLTIVVGMTWWGSRRVFRSSRLVHMCCFASILLFVALAGPAPSVLRAALMCSLVLLARCLYRSPSVMGALACALLVTLLLDPFAITDVGLQLSYVATIGIVYGSRATARRIGRIATITLPGWLAEAIAVVLVAQFSILPLQLSYFFQFGMLFLPANLLVAPAVPAVTALGFVSSACVLHEPTASLLGPLAAVLDGLAAYGLRWMLYVAGLVSGVESSKLTIGCPPLWSVLLYYGAFFTLLATVRRERHRLLAACLFLGAAGALLKPAPLPPLMVAVFSQAVVVVNQNRDAVCVGDSGHKAVRRFLAYHGIKAQQAGYGSLGVRSCGSIRVIDSSVPAVSLVLASPGAGQPENHQVLPAAQAVIVTSNANQPGEPESPARSRGKADGVQSQASGGGRSRHGAGRRIKGPDALAAALLLARAARAHWLVLGGRTSWGQSLPFRRLRSSNPAKSGRNEFERGGQASVGGEHPAIAILGGYEFVLVADEDGWLAPY